MTEFDSFLIKYKETPTAFIMTRILGFFEILAGVAIPAVPAMHTLAAISTIIPLWLFGVTFFFFGLIMLFGPRTKLASIGLLPTAAFLAAEFTIAFDPTRPAAEILRISIEGGLLLTCFVGIVKARPPKERQPK